MSKSNKTTGIPKEERALVLQGGGSLGAYEVGAYKALYEWLVEKDKSEGKEQSRTFDIIAGTSIGAMNSAVLASYVIENGTYEGSAERLLDFWDYLSDKSMADTNPLFKPSWDYLHSLDKNVATGEAARRYYAAQEFSIRGVPHVFSPPVPAHDKRFFDFLNNTWYHFNNEPLKKSLEKFAKFPIASAHEEGQPRLILVTVDVAKGLPVVFDSYAKEDGSRKTEYGNYIKQDGKEIGFEHVIRYDDGITADQVIASGCFPINFPYSLIEVESYSPSRFSSNPDSSGQYRKEIRHFWDGGLLTNTPLTQLVLLHRQYWYRIRGLKDKVPAITVAVINVHPTAQPEIPGDHDAALDRKNDISFSDRSRREEDVLLLLSDYIDLVRELIRIAKENGAKDEVITNLMNQRTKYHGVTMKPRAYKDIVEGRPDINEVVRLERKNSEHTISNKVFDFSSGTVTQLIKEGYEDALNLIKIRQLELAKKSTQQTR